MTRSPWMPYGIRDEVPVRLLCLPHAAAGAAEYLAWANGMESWIGACPLQPPGRGRRRQESPFTSVGSLACSLAAEILANVAQPFAIFGHSTGALSAFETARELDRIGGPAPVHLFVSGRRAPQIPIQRHDLAAMDLPELAEFLRGLGGTPEEVLADQSILGSLQAVMAADFRVNENYEYVDGPPLGIPVTAFAGTSDTGADPDFMTPWEKRTTGRFSLYELSGGHFAIFERGEQVHKLIAKELASDLG